MRLWSTTGIHVVVQWSQRRANVLTTRNATKETLFTVALHTTGGFYQLSCRDGPPTVATIEVLTCLPNERTAIMHGREKRHRGVKPNVWEWFPGKGSMGPVHLSVIAGLVNGGQPSNARLLACVSVCARVNLFEGPRAILPRSASVALRTLPSKITSCPRLTYCLRDFFVVSDPTTRTTTFT